MITMSPSKSTRGRFVGPYDPESKSPYQETPQDPQVRYRVNYSRVPYSRSSGQPGQGIPFNPYYSTDREREGQFSPDFFGRSAPVKTYGGNLKFSEREIKELFIAFVLLSFALAILLSHFSALGGTGITGLGLAASMLTVGTGFLLHEMGHKFSAQYFGCWSEFRASYRGLMLSIFLALVGFLIAMPGAVEIRGYMDKRTYGLVSLAGPAVNITISILFSPLLFILSGDALSVIQLVILLNLILALFNMIPKYPLDGSKIMEWDSSIYGIFAITTLLLFLLLFPMIWPVLSSG